MSSPATTVPIGDYGIIGDCRSAALVSRQGSIDWLCWPRFDSPALFAAILDPMAGGRCRIGPPRDTYQTSRRYVPGTAVLETTFHTATGVARITDCMPVASAGLRKRMLVADRQLLRVVDGIEGEVTLALDYAPRPDFANRRPTLQDHGTLGIYCDRAGRVAVMRSDLGLQLGPDQSECHGTAVIHAGERKYLSITYTDRGEVVLPILGQYADQQLRNTIDWWTIWSGRSTYQGQWPEAVQRSAITLKLLCYALSGAVVAAPTTSLPEAIGGLRNWDYRYCWIRDASLTLQSLFDLGYAEEADAFVSWLLYTTRITRPELQVMYDVYGGNALGERPIESLTGYAGSQPVRVGNAAHDQLQIDVYGEVLDAMYAFARRGGRLGRSSRRMIRDWAGVAMARWQQPDNGIWEKRADRQHHVYSLAMCWVALDRYSRLAEDGHLGPCDVQRYRGTQQQIRDVIESRGIHPELGCYVSELGGTEVDASLLMLAIHGYVEPTAPVMVATYERIVEKLGTDALLYRYQGDDGLPGGEGAFGICGFWAVSYLAHAARIDEAEQRFNRLLTFANDLGLYAEEVDPSTGAALGNFPQAFTHVGLIDAALTIEQARGGAPRAAPTATGKDLMKL